MFSAHHIPDTLNTEIDVLFLVRVYKLIAQFGHLLENLDSLETAALHNKREHRADSLRLSVCAPSGLDQPVGIQLPTVSSPSSISQQGANRHGGSSDFWQ